MFFAKIAARRLSSTGSQALQNTEKGMLSPTVLLHKMAQQYPKIYAKVNIFNFPFTVARHDFIVMHRIKDVKVGDVLKLDRIRELGTADYTVKGRPWISPDLFEIEATVMEHGRGAKVIAKQPKQRKGHRRFVTNKPLTTTLRIRDIKIKLPESNQ